MTNPQYALLPYTRIRRPAIHDRVQHVPSGRTGKIRGLTAFDSLPIIVWDGDEAIDYTAYNPNTLLLIVNERPVGSRSTRRNMREEFYTLITDDRHVDDVLLGLPERCLQEAGIKDADIVAALVVLDEALFPEIWVTTEENADRPTTRFTRVQ